MCVGWFRVGGRGWWLRGFGAVISSFRGLCGLLSVLDCHFIALRLCSPSSISHSSVLITS